MTVGQNQYFVKICVLTFVCFMIFPHIYMAIQRVRLSILIRKK